MNPHTLPHPPKTNFKKFLREMPEKNLEAEYETEPSKGFARVRRKIST